MRFRFFKINNEMERIEGSFETTHRTKTLSKQRSYGICSMADRGRHGVKVINL